MSTCPELVCRTTMAGRSLSSLTQSSNPFAGTGGGNTKGINAGAALGMACGVDGTVLGGASSLATWFD